jgi:hypothetical protein
MMLREKRTSLKKKYFKNFIDKFAEFLISKFLARLKSERVHKMQIKNELMKRKKKLFLEM